jgi:lysophospholipase L1-like esterase
MSAAQKYAFRAAASVLLGLLPGVVVVDLWVGRMERNQAGEQGGDEGYWLEDEQLGWVPRPHFENPKLETRLDRFGLRSPEIPTDALSREIRILGLGASQIYGARNVLQSQTWSYWLQSMLASETEFPVRVLNGGVMAYSLSQAARRGMRLLEEEREGVRLDPDLVMIAVSPGSQTLLDNSAAHHWVRVGDVLVEEDVITGWPRILVPARVAVHRLLLHSNLYARRQANRDRNDGGLPLAIQSWMLSKRNDPPELLERVDEAFAELDQLKVECERRGIAMVALLLAEPQQDSDERWATHTQEYAQFGAPTSTTPRQEGVELLAERCTALGIEYFDLSPALDRFPQDRTRYYADDGLHWSGEGHRLVTRVIYENLLKGDWIRRLEDRERAK